jgi:hypothetical protein
MLRLTAAQQFGGGIGRELLPDRIGEEVPQEEYVQAVQGAGAFGDQAETRSSRLSVSNLKIST